ncbi:hypothetical protein JCM6882_009388 [Rhodosporidiobolus microsporus]
MEKYASASLDSISYFSPANKYVFPELCNAAGYTDVDAYCNSGATELCCGLCPNTSVAGVGQFVWAIISYGIGSFCYTLAPEAVWGLAIFQAVNANCFIAAGMIRVGASAISGAMTLWHTQFLWPQALGFIFIMAPAVFAPQWSRMGENHVSMTLKIADYEAEKNIKYATRADVRAIELRLWKQHHHFWSLSVLAAWFLCMAVWTGLYLYVTLGNIEWSQSNCHDVIEYTLSPTAATIILGSVAWLLLVLDVVAYFKKEGMSDLIIDRFFHGDKRDFDEHRKLERKITIGVTLFLFILWLALNCWMYIEGMNKFLLTGADIMTFGQVEQFTALFPDLLGFVVAISAYLGSRAKLQEARSKVTSGMSTKSGHFGSSRRSVNFPPHADGRDSLMDTDWNAMDASGHLSSSSATDGEDGHPPREHSARPGTPTSVRRPFSRHPYAQHGEDGSVIDDGASGHTMPSYYLHRDSLADSFDSASGHRRYSSAGSSSSATDPGPAPAGRHSHGPESSWFDDADSTLSRHSSSASAAAAALHRRPSTASSEVLPRGHEGHGGGSARSLGRRTQRGESRRRKSRRADGEL